MSETSCGVDAIGSQPLNWTRWCHGCRMAQISFPQHPDAINVPEAKNACGGVEVALNGVTLQHASNHKFQLVAAFR